MLPKAVKRLIPKSLYTHATLSYLSMVEFIDDGYFKYKVDARCQSIVSKIRPYTMVGRKGLINTYRIVELVESAVEDQSLSIVECGVARGGISAMMALQCKNRPIWCFDSFEGLPSPTENDSIYNTPLTNDRHESALSKGYCLGTYEEVSDLFFNKLKLGDNVKLVKGWFEDTLPLYKSRVGKIAFLRMDGDWYESTKCVLESLYDNVVPGGYILIDDYYLAGCKKAVDEFFVKYNIESTMNIYGQGAYFRK